MDRRLLVVMTTLSLSLMACLPEEETVAVEPAIRPIAWMEVSASSLEQMRSIPGTVQAAKQADLSFEVGGKVQAVHVKLGDTVKAGTVLAELDESSYQLSSAASEGQLAEAKAVLVEAENTFQRQSELYQKGWVALAALDNARAALDRAKSNVSIAQAQLELSRKDLGDTALRAPYDGVITSRQVEPSQQVAAGQIILQIEGDGGLEVSVMAPETMIGSITRNADFDIHFPALPGTLVAGTVTEIGTQVETASAFPITLLLEVPVEGLRVGMSAEVDFVFEGRGRTGYAGEIVRVPPTALIAGPGQETFAFIYDPDAGVVRQRSVQTENIINNEVFISSGLEPGEIIAVAGLPYLYDGQKVTLMDVGPRIMN